MRILLSFVVLLSIGFPASSQQKFSFKFNQPHARSGSQPQLFSVGVKNSQLFLDQYGEEVVLKAHHPSSGTFHIEASRSWIVEHLTNDDNIVFVDILQAAHTESVNESSNPSFNRINLMNRHFPNLDGEGQVISIKEQGFDPDDVDLLNRTFFTSVSPNEISHHATAMATFIAGAGNSAETGRGVVPSAWITSSDFKHLLPEGDSIFVNHHIYLQNHSYGLGVENYYGNEAAAFDQQTFDVPALLHVFSAGNIGNDAPSSGKYQGLPFANLSGNFKQAKNVLTVSAVNEMLQIPTANSRGPAFDGRIKPELVAFGAGGTSDAAALVSGISAALQQQYITAFGELAPSSAIKAILIASADDLGRKGIDYESGYGSVNAFKAAALLDRGFISVLHIKGNDEETISLEVPDGASELKVAIAWTDPPATPNASNALVHDVDARLSDGATFYAPWKLHTSANVDSLRAAAFRGDDNLNNVEYITIEQPGPGTYSLVVKTPALISEHQTISVAWWLETGSFAWNYPVSTDVVEAATNKYLFWNATETEPGELSIRINEGEWKVIDGNVSLHDPFQWTVPDTLASAQLKMVVDGREFLSEEFLISPRPVMKVLFNCPERFALSWRSVPGSEAYQLFSLGETLMNPFNTTTDTMRIIQQPVTHRYFSVAPQYNGRKGLSSILMDYAAQAASCYVNLFNAIRHDFETVRLQLYLSTLYNVKEVAVYRLTNETRQLIFASAPTEPSLEWFDKNLVLSGVMRYQAEVVLQDGSVILSEVAEVHIYEKHTAVVYPNPLFTGVDLTVLSDGTGQIFRLVDGSGRIVKEVQLEFMEESLTLDALVPGLYFFQLVEGERVIDTGKLVKL